MKRTFFKTIVAAGALAVLFACSDSSTTPNVASIPEYASFTVNGDCYWLQGDVNYLIYADNNVVTDENGNKVGVYDPATGVISDLDGNPLVEGVDLSSLTPLNPEMVAEANAASEESNVDGGVKSSPSNGNNTSNSSVAPNNTTASSSSALGPVATTGDPEQDVKKYPVPVLKTVLGNGKNGWSSRYWDACKPHCAAFHNEYDPLGDRQGRAHLTDQSTYEREMTVARNCNINDIEIPAWTLHSEIQEWHYALNAVQSSCKDGSSNSTGAFTCTDMAPIAVNDTIAYAFVAGKAGNTSCGKCFHLQYDGNFRHGDPKATHKALKGKHLLVMTSNIGTDVEDGQFDTMIPGGGVGMYDALSLQVGASGNTLGERYGGFMASCQKEEKCGNDGSLECYQTCIRSMCDAAFGNSGYKNLYRGCLWYANWYMAADNPTYQYEEIDCPQYLVDKYKTTINTTTETNILPSDNWEKYKGGDFITTNACHKEKDAQGKYCNQSQLDADKAKSY